MLSCSFPCYAFLYIIAGFKVLTGNADRQERRLNDKPDFLLGITLLTRQVALWRMLTTTAIQCTELEYLYRTLLENIYNLLHRIYSSNFSNAMCAPALTVSPGATNNLSTFADF